MKTLESISNTKAVTVFLMKLGVPTHVKGYEYIKLVVLELLDHPEMIHQVTKVLYPEVAKKAGTTPSRVERAIRHAIEMTMYSYSAAELEELLVVVIRDKFKLTNSQFLATVAEKIRLQAGCYN